MNIISNSEATDYSTLGKYNTYEIPNEKSNTTLLMFKLSTDTF